MTTYNPNDFYPRTGQKVKSDGTTVNEADGLNSDGSQNVKIAGIASSQSFQIYNGSINAGATLQLKISTLNTTIQNLFSLCRRFTIQMAADSNIIGNQLYGSIYVNGSFGGSDGGSLGTSATSRKFAFSTFDHRSDDFEIDCVNGDTIAHTVTLNIIFFPN